MIHGHILYWLMVLQIITWIFWHTNLHRNTVAEKKRQEKMEELQWAWEVSLLPDISFTSTHSPIHPAPSLSSGFQSPFSSATRVPCTTIASVPLKLSASLLPSHHPTRPHNLFILPGLPLEPQPHLYAVSLPSNLLIIILNFILAAVHP